MSLLRIKFQLSLNEQESILKMQILDMPEKWRNAGVIYSNQFVSICSHASPELYGFNIVYLRGRYTDRDLATVSFRRSSVYYSDNLNYLKNIIGALCELTKDNSVLYTPIAAYSRNWEHTFTWQLKKKQKSHPLTKIFF